LQKQDISCNNKLMPTISGSAKLRRVARQFSLLILILSLQGCSTLGNPTGKGTPVPQIPTRETAINLEKQITQIPKGTPVSPIPTLEPAINFEKGVSQVPNGYFILIEFGGSSVCSDECNCAPAPPAPPHYQFTSSGELLTDQPDIIPALSTPIVGFFGRRGTSGTDILYVIDKLPYKPFPDGWFTIYSIDTLGTTTVEIGDKAYFIRPGQSWTDSGDVKQEPPVGCRMSYNSRLSNFGLVPQAKIRFVNVLP
jgi:hypothetical protein